jgi:hypothetical protein
MGLACEHVLLSMYLSSRQMNSWLHEVVIQSATYTDLVSAPSALVRV